MEENSLHACKFPKSHRILKRREFIRIAKFGEVLRGKYLIIHQVNSEEGDARLGITVTKRFGKSHERNYFKRIVREIFRTIQFPSGLDLIVRPRHLAKEANFHDIKEEFYRLLAIESTNS
ncbi:MAG: ribonuclease P protein component [Waddliaceae bacterium]